MDYVHMASVARLVTLVDVVAGDEGHAVPQFSCSARLDAVLDDGRRVILLNGRGWSQTILTAGGHGPSRQGYSSGWSVTREAIEESAWDVVGPDYPDATAVEAHWAWLAEQLGREGVEIDPTDLAAMPREVEFGSRIRRRLRG